ncbi:MAG TPA: thiamine ABC transporter substrate-binding protein [Anaerolineaceae bacterium]|nr:thiamine ABC transporter substrate-binding protein [Anaerolineaceae bacterium]
MFQPVRLLYISLVALLLAGCTATPSGGTTAVSTLTVMTHDSFAISAELVTQFEQAHHARLVFVPSGDTGAALNRAILSKEAPQADVFYGVDNTFLARALEAGIFESYDSPLLADIPASFRLDPENGALPVDYGDVCINYDRAYFEDHKLPVPQTLSDLTKPEYAGLLVVENPATSSPGLAFLMATIANFSEERYLDFWVDLRENGVVVVNDWETAYYTNFSGSSGRGPQPLVVSYNSSPAAEYIFADPPVTEPPTASITGPLACYRQVEFVGILSGTSQRMLAEQFVDFMLSVPFQEDVPEQMFVFPVNSNAALPEPFTRFTPPVDQPALLDPGLVAENRDRWIQEWSQSVLR